MEHLFNVILQLLSVTSLKNHSIVKFKYLWCKARKSSVYLAILSNSEIKLTIKYRTGHIAILVWHFYYEEWNLISFVKELIFDSDIKVKKQWPLFPGLKWHEFLNSLVYVRYLYTPSGPREITFLTFKEINRQNFSKMEQGLFPLPVSCLSTRLSIMNVL